MTGQLLGDRYQVGDTLGFGGMSEVHRGRDLRLGRDVAIKVLRADLARDPSFQSRFRREAQNAASLNHPAVVAVYDTGDSVTEAGNGLQSIPYIVMEYVDGDTLRDVLKREGPLPPRRAMEIVADICAALDFSHRHGIVHRDVKPANVMLTGTGAVKVMDFGIARAVTDGQATMTGTSAVIGTAQYLSPEQARGEAVDARSDVYATGCVLYELMTGAPPFTGDSPVAIAYQHVREAPRPPSELNPDLPAELDAIVLKALNKNPLNRYQTAAEMRSDLVRALSGQAVHATPLMSDDERTELMRATPARVGGGAPPLLAPPQRPVAEDDWEPEEGDRSRKVWGFVGIGVLCLALVAGAIWLVAKLLSAPPPAALVAVPDLSNLSVEEATAKLRDSRLTLGTVTPTESTDDQKDKVVGQRPSKQTQVAQDSAVNLEIGKGVVLISVPNVVQYSPEAAKQALNEANLQYQEVQASSSDADKGKALSQDPAAQAQVAPGSVVKVTIGTGLQTVEVPGGIAGQPVAQAQAALAAAKLQVVVNQVDSSQPSGQVISMDPAAGARVQEGTVVTLQVSNGQLFKMPNLQNRSVESALNQLANAGWNGDASDLTRRTQQVTQPGLVGAVIGQDPAAGSELPRSGTQITLTIGVGGPQTPTTPPTTATTPATTATTPTTTPGPPAGQTTPQSAEQPPAQQPPAGQPSAPASAPAG